MIRVSKKSNHAFLLFIFASSTALASGDVAKMNDGTPEAESTSWISHIGLDLLAPFHGPGLDVLLIGSGATVSAYPFRNVVTDVGEDKPLGSKSGIGYKLGLWHINAAYVLGYMG